MPMSREIARAFMWGIVEVPPEPKSAPAEMTEADREKIRGMFAPDEESKQMSACTCVPLKTGKSAGTNRTASRLAPK